MRSTTRGRYAFGALISVVALTTVLFVNSLENDGSAVEPGRIGSRRLLEDYDCREWIKKDTAATDPNVRILTYIGLVFVESLIAIGGGMLLIGPSVCIGSVIWWILCVVLFAGTLVQAKYWSVQCDSVCTGSYCDRALPEEGSSTKYFVEWFEFLMAASVFGVVLFVVAIILTIVQAILGCVTCGGFCGIGPAIQIFSMYAVLICCIVCAFIYVPDDNQLAEA